MSPKKTIIIMLLALYFCTPSWASAPSNEALFHRCYRTITGLRFPLLFNSANPQDNNFHSTLVTDLGAGADPIELCIRVLDYARLHNTSGLLINDTPLAQRILNHWTSIHQGFFETVDFYGNPILGVNNSSIYDQTSPAYYFTRALFTDIPYASIVTSPHAIGAVRTDTGSETATTTPDPNRRRPRASMDMSQPFPDVLEQVYFPGIPDIGCMLKAGMPSKCNSQLNPLMPMTGSLRGFFDVSSSSSFPLGVSKNDQWLLPYTNGDGIGLATTAYRPSYMNNSVPNTLPCDSSVCLAEPSNPFCNPCLNSSPSIQPGWAGRYLRNPQDRFYYHRGHGGGFLGDPSFIQHQWSLEYNPIEIPDGGLNLSRTWARGAAWTALCRQLPLLRSTDVLNDVQVACTTSDMDDGQWTPAGCSKLTFRTAVSCMSCHKTIDPWVSLLGNFRALPAIYSSSQGNSLHIVPYMPNPAAPAAPSNHSDLDPYFHLRTHQPTIHMRGLSGQMISRQVSSIQQLGEFLASTEDFYACAASRYLEEFTGVRVGLDDMGEKYSMLSKDEQNYFNLVKRLGEEFRASGNEPRLMELFKSILRHPIYRTRSMRLEELEGTP